MEVEMEWDRRRIGLVRNEEDGRRWEEKGDFDAWFRRGSSLDRSAACQTDRPPTGIERVVGGQSAKSAGREVCSRLVNDWDRESSSQLRNTSITHCSFSRHPFRDSLTRKIYSTPACIPT